MKSAILIVFMLIGFLSTKTLYAQRFHESASFLPIATSFSSAPRNTKLSELQPNLHLHIYRRDRGHRLQNTGGYMLISGVASITTSLILINDLNNNHRSNQGSHYTTPKTKSEIRKSLFAAGGIITGPPLIISGTIVLISGSLKLRH